SPSELRARVGGRGADVLSATPRFAAAVYERAAGRSLVVPLLAGALLLLGAESLATRRQGRR
ncbi:MAG TPA: hypothetical protein VFY16_04285, partial [Gemmatimonadaceae bacterium]|nr:hypothetical protein [Gemmatimonadaceae bacterium]